MPEEVFETSQPAQPIAEPKPTNWPKIILATVLGFGLLAAAAYAGYWYGTQKAQGVKGEVGSNAIYKCEEDDECVLVRDGCCGCSAGGRNTVVNRNYLGYWNKKLSEECKGIMCPEVISDHWTCFAKPKCVNNKCQLLEEGSKP